MYKIRKPPSDDGGNVFPVATIPMMLRNNFQFFSRCALRYFNYVGRHTQGGKIRHRVAIVVQNQLIIADLKGNAKRCVNISKVSSLLIEAGTKSKTTRLLITIPSEYDMLLDVIRGGHQLVKSLILTGQMIGSNISVRTGCIDVRRLSLNCPSGMRKNRTFELEPGGCEAVSTQQSKTPSSSSDGQSRADDFISTPSPSSNISKKQSAGLRSVKFSDSSESYCTLAGEFPRKGNLLAPAVNLELISQGSESSNESDDEPVLIQHRMHAVELRRRSVAEHLLLDGLDATVVAALALVSVVGVEKRQQNASPSTRSIWCEGDHAEVFQLQPDGFMDWLPCLITDSSESHAAVKIHVSSYSAPSQLLATVRRSQLRRPVLPRECSSTCWCKEHPCK
eukprot:TRINITY_DN16331_c0_g1_i1.p1 TRINITY_DN16331_c0_g1~~TRINITY_DN16331_c0_g1_i1.p1  ORF type:complete len:407 (+),score=55.03 TRINITY_DN16331_c0_g1_i1:44-1222(+)